MRHKSCGLLNKLTQSNFDNICTKLVDWAVAVERTGDSRVLDVLVHDIFSRGVADHVRSRLYASLCQRIIDELEGERSLGAEKGTRHTEEPNLGVKPGQALRLLA